MGKDWKKNPKKAIIPVLGVIIVAGFVNNFFHQAIQKTLSHQLAILLKKFLIV